MLPAASTSPESQSVVVPQQAEPALSPRGSDATAQTVFDDSGEIRPGDSVLLIVENDTHFARYLVDLGRESGFKAVVAPRGAAALKSARELKPHAITLDINLPDIDGWRVLDRLKDDLATRHIPVQIITTDEERERGLRMGAIGALTKPLRTREVLDEAFAKLRTFHEPRERRVILVEASDAHRQQLCSLIDGESIKVISVGTSAEAMTAIRDPANAPLDLFITGLELPDRKGFELIDDLADEPAMREVPIIVYSPKDLGKKEELHLKRLSHTMVLKDVRSPERLVDEAALFLHRPAETLPEPRRKILEELHQTGRVLEGKKVLIVDDDIRNIFAMTSLLEPHQMQILSSETGRGAVELLQHSPDIDVVLMDIMMPDMDGYDTMRTIRKLARFRSLPIIALTAKAMKGDREKCIEAGASDYISKPVDSEQLLALLRVWLHR